MTKMIDKAHFHVFNFIKKEEYTGSMDGMRYLLRKLEEGAEKYLEVIIWPQPFSFGKTPEETKQRMRFPFDEASVEAAADWLNEQYVAQKNYGKSAGIDRSIAF